MTSVIEILGSRLDFARTALSNSTDDWAVQYWKRQEKALLRKWVVLTSQPYEVKESLTHN